MSFDLNIDGEDLKFASAADAATFFRELKQTVPSSSKAVTVKVAAANGKPPNKSLKAVLDKLNDNAKRMIKAVANAPDSTIEAKALAASLGLDGSSLGGTRASFTKYLAAHRFTANDYLSVTGKAGKKVYAVPQDRVDELRTALRF